MELPAPEIPTEAPVEAAAEVEESIYDQMKATMRRQKEELDAKNAQWKQQQRSGGRPTARGPGNTEPAAAMPVVEVIADPTNLVAVWQAARRHFDSVPATRKLETVLGPYCHLESVNPATGEAVLAVPNNYQNFTSENARVKMEESLRLITALPLKLTIHFVEPDPAAKAAAEASRNAGGGSAVVQRVPPEVMDAVKQQPVVQELMKKLDATIVNVELLNTDTD